MLKQLLYFIFFITASVISSFYHYISIILFGFAIIMFFRINLVKNSKQANITFAIFTIIFDAYNDNVIGMTFLCLLISYDLFKLFLTILNNPNYASRHPLICFVLFITFFTIIYTLFSLALHKRNTSIFFCVLNPIILSVAYFILLYNEKKLKFKFIQNKNVIY